MLTNKENELLCRVEGDAPMGQLMRRHWTPVCLIEEVSEPDGKPVKRCHVNLTGMPAAAICALACAIVNVPK